MEVKVSWDCELRLGELSSGGNFDSPIENLAPFYTTGCPLSVITGVQLLNCIPVGVDPVGKNSCSLLCQLWSR